MQRGIATLEIIIAVMIIATLTKIAVPNIEKIIDTAALDYEHKRLYSELRFVQSTNRSSIIFDKGMQGVLTSANSGKKPTLSINRDKNFYQVFREEGLDNPIREPHYISYGVTIYYLPKSEITFDAEGKSNISDHITLRSRLGKTKKITFDSVGRMQ